MWVLEAIKDERLLAVREAVLRLEVREALSLGTACG